MSYRNGNLFNLLLLSLMFVGCGSSCTTDKVEEDTSPPITTPGEQDPIIWEDCGGNLGDHPCDFTFTDQEGNSWSLYEHYGKVIVLDFSTMWCGYCRVAASEVQAMQDLYGPDGFIWVTLLVEDNAGGDVSLDEVQLWANTYGIETAPVLAANRSIIDVSAEEGYPVTSWPMFILIDEEMKIHWGLRGWSQEMLIEAIEGLLDE